MSLEIKPYTEMYCFASENQIYTGTVVFGVETFNKGQENLMLKNLQLKTRVENVRFFCREEHFFFEKYGIQSTNEIALIKGLCPAIRFDAPTLLSFSECTHAHAKCPLFTFAYA